MTQPLTLNAKPLFMVIDLQKAIDHPSWLASGKARNNPQAEANIAELLSLWRSKHLPILHVKHMSREPQSHYRPGQAGNDFKVEAIPHEGEEILEKDTNSAFIRTNLEQRLRQRGIDTLVISGVITNNSVEATARMAGNLGFHTFIVADACFTFGKVDILGKWHDADEVHAMSLANLAGEYATITSSATIKSSLRH